MIFTSKLKAALKSTRDSFGKLFSSTRRDRLTPDQLDELEESLLLADLGMETVSQLMELIERGRGRKTWDDVQRFLLETLHHGEVDLSQLKTPLVILVVGVNGTGKTTTSAKLARWFRESGKSVLLIGADTYRAAAIEQLEIWSQRLNIRLISNPKTQDPSSVVFDGLESARRNQTDVVIVDTAGRLHTSRNLMVELEKIVRVADTRFPEFTTKTLLTLDANLGQNSLSQTRQFQEYINLDGVILTKMDGSAKGGVVFPVIRNYHLPVWFIGTGEHLDDLEPFDAELYLQGLMAEDDANHE